MLIAPIALMALMLAGDDAGRVLVERLYSPQSKERASDDLERIGLPALPALRSALSREDVDGNSRARELIERIGSRRLLRPTSLTIDLRETSVADAAAELSRRAGLGLVLENEDDPRWRERKVTFRSDDPIPFWDAVERLAEAGSSKPLTDYVFSARNAMPRVRLGIRDGAQAPACVAGPYRLAITRIRRHREITQLRPPDRSKVRQDFHLDLEIVAEPGILIEGNGAIRLLEASDDRGRDLRGVLPTGAAQASITPRSWSSDSLSVHRVALPLDVPEERGKSIARLRGDVPIIALVRTDEIASLPFDGSETQTFSTGDATIRIGPIPGQNRAKTLEIVPNTEAMTDGLAMPAGPRQKRLSIMRPAYSPDDHLRIEDKEGRVLASHTQPLGPPGPDGRQTFRLNIAPNPGLGPPDRLRYYGIAAAAIEVPFDFKELPIP